MLVRIWFSLILYHKALLNGAIGSTDMRHARYHTKLLIRAIEWERKDFEKSLLLTGNDLQVSGALRHAMCFTQLLMRCALRYSLFISARATLALCVGAG